MFLPFSLILSKSIKNTIIRSSLSIQFSIVVIVISMLTLFVPSPLPSFIHLGFNHRLIHFHQHNIEWFSYYVSILRVFNAKNRNNRLISHGGIILRSSSKIRCLILKCVILDKSLYSEPLH